MFDQQSSNEGELSKLHRADHNMNSEEAGKISDSFPFPGYPRFPFLPGVPGLGSHQDTLPTVPLSLNITGDYIILHTRPLSKEGSTNPNIEVSDW